MNDHYYSQTPASESRPLDATFTYRGKTFTMTTDAGVFSRGELDAGTRVLLSALPQTMHGTLLDLGCGWGAIGISLAALYPGCSVTFADVNSRALALAKNNALRTGVNGTFILSDGFAAINGVFDCIITNPPIRAGKQTIYQMFADSASHLAPGGHLYLVIRKQQGAQSAIKYLSTVFSHLNVIEKSGGFWVIHCMNGGNSDEV